MHIAQLDTNFVTQPSANKVNIARAISIAIVFELAA